MYAKEWPEHRGRPFNMISKEEKSLFLKIKR